LYNKLKEYFAKITDNKSGNIVILFVVLQLALIIISLLYPDKFRYVSQANMRVLFRAIPTLGIIALGVNLLMISGEFDLSVGSNFAFSALILAILFNSGVPVFVSIIVALIVGSIIGAINGVITVKSQVPSFIITLGSMMFWRGMVILVSQGQAESFRAPDFYRNIFISSFGVIQMQFVWFIIVAIVTWLILERHKFGNYTFASGGDKKTAKALGININLVKIINYSIVGFLTAFAAIISTMRVQQVSPQQGEGLELQAIAACVIGGTALMGGKGSVMAAVLGASLLFTIEDVLILLRAPGFYLQLFIGLLIIVAAVINQKLSKE